jgi:type IV pilus assembly protein PilF
MSESMMRTPVSARRLRPLAAAALLALLLAGCAGGPAGVDASPAGKDIVTASDESDGARRARVRMELATAYFGRGQMTTALDQVKLAIAADPTSSEAFNLRGLIYANLGDDRLAEESFRHALELNPRDADAMHNFGYYLCQKKRYPEADAMYERALAVPQYREQARTLLAQGVCNAQAGRLDAAEAALQRAHDADPANPFTAMNLADVLYRRGEYERARFYVRRVNAQPAQVGPQTLWLAARIENRLGNRRGAQELGDQLVARYPNSREAASYQRGSFDD